MGMEDYIRVRGRGAVKNCCPVPTSVPSAAL